MNGPLPVSIIISTHNKVAYLRAALQSLRTLAFRPECFEVLVVNDGSTDQTEEFLSQYQAEYCLRQINKENGGLASARNAGIAAASGELLVMLDNDCLLSPTSLDELWAAYRHFPERMHISTIRHIDIRHVSSVMSELDAGHASFVLSEDYLVSEENEYALQKVLRLVKKDFENLAAGWFGAQGPSVSLSAELFRQLNGYDEAIKVYGMEDFDLAFRFAKRGGRLNYVDKATVFHLDHGHSQLNLFSETAASTQYFYRKHCKYPETKAFVQFLSEQITFLEFNNKAALSNGMAPSTDGRLDLRFSVYRMLDYRGAQKEQQETTLPQLPGDSQKFCLELLLKKICGDIAVEPKQGIRQLDDLPGKHVLLLAPHMDDEVIGCGGLIHHYQEQGAKVTVAFCTSGPGSPRKTSTDETASITRERITESKRAAQILGVSELIHFNLPERKLLRWIDTSDQLEKLLEVRGFDTIYVTGPDEFHPDHKATWKWVQRSISTLTARPAIYLYEVWGSCKPDCLLPLSDAAWERKERAMMSYQTQLRQLDYAKVMHTLAEQRGRMLDPKEGAPVRAEAFRRVF